MLFEIRKLEATAPAPSAGGAIQDIADQAVATGAPMQRVLNMVDALSTIHWLSEGDWSMHQLLEGLLIITGPADVWISSYAFSELPARKVADLKATGAIRSLQCVIDSRVDVRSASALSIMKNTADRIKLCHTHAKVTVLQNEDWHLVVVGSANYTTNKRYEAGIISADRDVVAAHIKWIRNELDRP